MKFRQILVTGGTGFIGSHTVIKLIENSYEVIILDNLSNSSAQVIDKIIEITGGKLEFIKGDVTDKAHLQEIFSKNQIDAVIHFAGLKSVSESVNNPVKYFENNFVGSLNLIDTMIKFKVLNLVFSSSATVYGSPDTAKCAENSPLNPVNPYGRSKLFVEQLISDTHLANDLFKYAILRYFNPVGAHTSGLIGENPIGTPNNLFPYLSQVAIGKLAELSIWGNDYPTPDGTGRRDYIHVLDLADGHLAALSALEVGHKEITVNLGTGNPHSVLEVIETFKKITEKEIRFNFKGRREGDIAESFADVQLAKEVLNWTSKYSLEDMCRDAWNWQHNNPNGFN